MQVEHVQCFLLMSSFLCSVNCLPQAWLLVGQAVRAAQDIGLHVSSHIPLFDISCYWSNTKGMALSYRIAVLLCD